MSDKTKAALDDAIRAHVTDESEDGEREIVTSWAVLVSTLTSDGDDETPGYWLLPAPGQAIHTTPGLIEYHRMGISAQVIGAME